MPKVSAWPLALGWAGLTCLFLSLLGRREGLIGFAFTGLIAAAMAATDVRGATTVLLLAVLLGFVVLAAVAMRQQKVWAALLASALLAGILVRASGGDGSPEPMFEWLRTMGLDFAQADAAVRAIRKTIHFLFYGVLGWAFYRGLRLMGVPFARAFGLGLLWTLLHASFDEGHQSFIPGRTGQPMDVLLDLSGATTMVGLARWREKRSGDAEVS